MNKSRRWIVGLVLVVILAAVVMAMLRPTEIPVQTAVVEHRTLRVTVQEQGRTRARLPYTIAAPVAGQLLRSSLIEGDQVREGQLMARIALLPEDQRNEATLRANLSAAEARRASAEAAVNEAESARDRARREHERRVPLFERRLIGEEELEIYYQTLQAADSRLLSARALLETAQAEVESASARLLGIDGEQNGHSIETVIAPVDGTVLKVHERGERVVQAGTPLFSLSNDDALELVIDLLTQDAVRVSPGDRILISGWGGDQVLEGRVSYIEPEAFTKFSALGVEEQRVNVVGDLLDPDSPLGAGYRIEAAIVVWEEEDVLTVPTSALFRRSGQWQVFVIVDDRAELRSVETGQRSVEHAQVVSGLAAGDQVVIFPTDQVQDGVRVAQQ